MEEDKDNVNIIGVDTQSAYPSQDLTITSMSSAANDEANNQELTNKLDQMTIHEGNPSIITPSISNSKNDNTRQETSGMSINIENKLEIKESYSISNYIAKCRKVAPPSNNMSNSNIEALVKDARGEEVCKHFLCKNDTEHETLWKIIFFMLDIVAPIPPCSRISAQREEKSDTDPPTNMLTHNAFYREEFINNHNLLERFLQQLDDCAKLVNFFKAVTLINSSMTGKSKLIQKMGKVRYTIYTSLTASELTIPCRSPHANSLLDREILATDWINAWLLTLIGWFNDTTKSGPKTAEAWWSYHQDKTAFEVFSQNLAAVRKAAAAATTTTTETIAAAEEKNKQAAVTSVATTSEFNLFWAQVLPAAAIVFAFDEARSLLIHEKSKIRNDFQILRRSITTISEVSNHRIVAIFTDTNSKISNFAPARIVDSSLREGCYDLVPPFFQLTNIDIFAPSVDCELNNEHDVKAQFHPKIIFCYGRPAWASLLNHNYSAQQLCSLAQLKMLCSSQIQLLAQNELQVTDEELICALACLSCRLNIEFVGNEELSSELVASHMALCVFVSSSRESTICTYPSEPILAEASARLMWRIKLESHGSGEEFLKVFTDHPLLKVNNGGTVGDSNESGSFFNNQGCRRSFRTSKSDKSIHDSENTNQSRSTVARHTNKIGLSQQVESKNNTNTQHPSDLHLQWSQIRVALHHLCSEVIHCGLVEAGARGELLARILCILGMDVAHLCTGKFDKHFLKVDHIFAQPIPLVEFTQSLLGTSDIKNDLLSSSNALVAFNHFIYVSYVPSSHDLKRAFLRSAAIICPRNHPGADLIIPLWLPQGMSFVLIQVKNLVTQGDKDEVVTKLRHEYVFHASDLVMHQLPYVTLYMQLGTPNIVACESFKVVGDNNQRVHGEVYGLSSSVYPFLYQSGCERLLEHLLHAWRDPVTIGKPQNNASVVLMLPLRYKSALQCGCTKRCMSARCMCRKNGIKCGELCGCKSSSCFNNQQYT